ncbi:MAG: hypothetical protein IJO10_05560 [Clostridia bacterium]|nr:hypothetical protein [Clostridia bacterium]
MIVPKGRHDMDGDAHDTHQDGQNKCIKFEYSLFPAATPTSSIKALPLCRHAWRGIVSRYVLSGGSVPSGGS